jgi:flagellar FliJ protein
MSSWAKSLIKLATYEVEVLQKRLAEIADRRMDGEMKLVMLDAEGEAEMARARNDADAGWYNIGFFEGLRARKAEARVALETLEAEERGARDALAQAFEAQKKYEQVAEQQRTLALKETARRETAALDELGLRRVAR